MTDGNMILIGIGSNLGRHAGEQPVQAARAALALLEARGVEIAGLSPWYETEPVPPSGQPWFVNAVAQLRTALGPGALLEVLHEIEAALGRRRTVRNEARVVDLDLLDYEGRVMDGDGGLVLPHPRMCGRRFVLAPLADLAPEWRHPVTGRTAAEMLAALPSGQAARRMEAPAIRP